MNCIPLIIIRHCPSVNSLSGTLKDMGCSAVHGVIAIHTIGDEVSFSTIGFLEIVLHAFAQNNDLVRIFHSIFFALVDKLRAKS